ncbi:unnamed protein product [Lactuca saligna]|uniref:Uncharacterized protein n=1 Tax=Lactuca saligna TaxID=75948 RepID=A0AA35VU49_LACSI|nr:unnamed protein product [Lactuca saligna]
MASSHSLGRNLTAEEYESFQFRFGFVPEHDVQIPLSDVSPYSPPEGKFEILIVLFEIDLSFPTTEFFNLNIRENEFSVGGIDSHCYKQYSRIKAYVDCAPTLFGADKELADNMEKININDEDLLDFFLATDGMSPAWRAPGKMLELFVEKEGGEEIISLERDL